MGGLISVLASVSTIYKNVLFSYFLLVIHSITSKRKLSQRNRLVLPLESFRTSLVIQMLRIHLPMQGTQAQSLVWEDSTCHGQLGPHTTTSSPHSRAWGLQQEKLPRWEAHAPWLERSPYLPQPEKVHTQQWRPSAAPTTYIHKIKTKRSLSDSIYSYWTFIIIPLCTVFHYQTESSFREWTLSYSPCIQSKTWKCFAERMTELIRNSRKI